MIPWSPDLVVGFLIGLAAGVAGMAGALAFALVRGNSWRECALAQQRALAAYQQPPAPSAPIIPFPQPRRG